MFHATILASELLQITREGADISFPVSDSEMLMWLNSVEQKLYSEIIQEEREKTLTGIEADAVIPYTSLGSASDESVPEERDILIVTADHEELEHVSAGGGVIWHAGQTPVWYGTTSGIKIDLEDNPDEVKIAYTVRPVLYTMENKSTEYVHMVPEFVPMLVSKLKGELYRLANEDGQAAKWFADYNQELETFKVWAERHCRHYGV